MIIVTVYCDVCSLEFSSQVVLDTHLAGSKHQRKLKSKELMKNLEETESGFERNTVSGVIRCTICDVTVNSPQLLATHVAGNKHKSKKGNKAKRENGEEGGTPAKKLCSGATGQANGKTGGSAAASGSDGAKKDSSGNAAHPKKKERTPLQIQIPACVSKLEDTKAGGKFLCNPCQAHCNSDVQLSQHLSSKKHVDKVSGKKKGPPPPSATKSSGRGSGWKGGLFGKGRGLSSSRTSVPTQKWDSLTSSSALLSSSLANSYSTQSTFPDSSLASSYTDSYGLSSLGRSTATDYSFSRSSSSSARGSGLRGSSSTTYGRSDPYSRSDGSYGRAASTYTRTEVYPRAEYATEYQTARADDLSSYSRAATEYAATGYGAEYSHGYAASHAAPRGVPFTYTQPLSQNFVSGGSIL
ncbi:Zinc finger matrin-type protein 1 [Armadillidium vulgare]|nr:Zinc finger matrin-type protein 1 [Armadillidium vulgare]